MKTQCLRILVSVISDIAVVIKNPRLSSQPEFTMDCISRSIIPCAATSSRVPIASLLQRHNGMAAQLTRSPSALFSDLGHPRSLRSKRASEQ
jgi:hypothetical protein